MFKSSLPKSLKIFANFVVWIVHAWVTIAPSGIASANFLMMSGCLFPFGNHVITMSAPSTASLSSAVTFKPTSSGWTKWIQAFGGFGNSFALP